MITIISGTNRKNSITLKVAQQYAEIFEHLGQQVQVLDLKTVTEFMMTPEMYIPEDRDQAFTDLQEQFMIKADKFIFLAPEYNGGIPGVLKLFLDACSVHLSAESFKGKKAALIGIAAGRAGNLRGLDYLSNILHYLGVVIMPNKIPISTINFLMTEGKITDERTLELITQQAKELIEFNV